MKVILLVKITLIVLFFGVVGCSSSLKNDGITTSTTLDGSYPYPSNVNVTIVPELDSYPYPGEAPSQESEPEYLPAPLVIPTPELGKVVFSGQMLTPGPGGSPYVGDVYLAYLVEPNESNNPPLIKFSEESNPKAMVDTEGHFYFANVDPGKYALIIYSLGGAYIVNGDDGQTLFITGEANQSVDLGIISVH